MIPTSLAAILAFFFFVVPGLIYEMMLERIRANRVETRFREVSRIALVSAPCSTLTGLILWTLVPPHQERYWAGLFGQWVTSGSPPTGHTVAVLLFLSAATACVSSFAVWLTIHKNKDKWYPNGAFIAASGWTKALTPRGDNQLTVAIINLDDATQYSGVVESFSPGVDWSNREITLVHPLVVKRGGVATRMTEDTITFSSAHIVSIEALWTTEKNVAYVMKL